MEQQSRRPFGEAGRDRRVGIPFELEPEGHRRPRKIVLALMGGRKQGRGDALGAIAQGAELKTFCDIDQAILHKVNPDLVKARTKLPEPSPSSIGSVTSCRRCKLS